MAATKREWLVRYDEMLNGVSEKSLAALDEALEAFDFGADPYEVRSGLIRIMMPMCGGSATTASAVAARFYDGLREKKLGERLGATPDSGREPEATARAVHAFVSNWEKDRDDERLKRALRQRLDYEVRKSANMTIQRNAERDPGSSRYARNFAGNQKARAYEERKAARRGRYRAGRDTGVRYARVPMGLETCEFCIMLASRGFVYHDEELAGHAHAHCDCRVIPDFEGKASSIEGYDPGYYLDCYKHPDEHPEIRDAINARRRELRAERKLEEASRDALHRKVSDEFGERTPADDEFVELYRQFVEKLGGTFRFVETEEERRYFEYFGIGGTTDSVGVVLRPDPTMSDVIEEAFHYQQIVEGRFGELGEPITGCLREIEAKKFLLNNASVYNILEEETIETERELEKYLTDLDRLSEKNGTDFSKYLRG